MTVRSRLTATLDPNYTEHGFTGPSVEVGKVFTVKGPPGPPGGPNVPDGDKGDIVVSGGGTAWTLDSAVVTPAARTVLDDASVAAMRVTLGAAALASPVFTGDPQAPTPTAGDNDTSIATTAFVSAAVAAGGMTQAAADTRYVNVAGDSMSGSLSITGGIQTSLNAGIGDNTGGKTIQIFGGSSGTSAGAAFMALTGGVTNIAFGNKSLLLGGAYDATPFIYASSAIEIYSAAGLKIASGTPSTSTTTGALTVAGGVGVAGALNVAGTIIGSGNVWANTFQLNGGGFFSNSGGVNQYAYLADGSGNSALFLGGTAINQNIYRNSSHFFQSRDALTPFANMTATGVQIYPTTASTSTTTGALIVAGGVGIGGSAYLGGAINVVNGVVVTGSGGVSAGSGGISSGAGGLLSSGPATITSTLASSSSTTGALVVSGGAGIVGRLNVGNSQAIQATTGLALPTVGCGLAIGYHGTDNFGLAFRPTVDNGTSIYFLNAANINVGSITNSSTATAYVTSSDGRLKEDLQPINSGAMIDAIEAYDFRWKSTAERSFGVIAQDAAKVLPQACHHDEQADQWGTDYSKFVPILLAEMKALRARVAELEGK
jgi:hypothetical protein